MTEPHDPQRPSDPGDDDDAIRALIRRSLGADQTAGPTPDLLGGVQKLIRKRSKGKFFADGWSTTQARASYALVALVTLLLVALAYYALGPMDVR